MAVKKVSRKNKGHYATYKAADNLTKNKIRKLERHMKKFPLDQVAQAKLDGIKKARKAPWIRKTPKTKGGWNHARFDQKAPNSNESIMASLTLSQARNYAEVRASCDTSKMHMSKVEREQKRSLQQFWDILYNKYEAERRARDARRKKGAVAV